MKRLGGWAPTLLPEPSGEETGQRPEPGGRSVWTSAGGWPGTVSRDSDPELWALQREELECKARNEDLSDVWRRMAELKRSRRGQGAVAATGALVAGRYELREQIGYGGFGSVWTAYDPRTRALVAVKVLHHHLSRSQERVERFVRGARTMARLEHASIVRVLETDQWLGASPCFVMEYVSGGDLTKAQRAGRIAGGAVVPILTALCKALVFAHGEGVIHRDIKPDNILLDAAGHPKLTDFDLVHAEDTTGATVGGMGSLLYCSREQMQDASRVDGRTDVFALGMVGVFMLGGEPAVHEVRFSPAAARELRCDSRLSGLLETACAAKPEHRLVSAERFLQHLRELQSMRLEGLQPPSAMAGRTDESGRLEVPVLGLKPSWAVAAGADEHGRWADVDVAGVRVRMRGIRAGTFPMGSPKDEPGRFDNERMHQVTLTRGYWLGATPVTQALWEAVMGHNPSHFKGAQLPVERVKWSDVQDFLARLNRRVPGLEARLPTEAEWEYACRAGTAGARYGADIQEIAWFGENAGGTTHAVGEKPPNAWGLYDMLGNVWEWCADWYGSYPTGASTDPSGPEGGSNRVNRGGSWIDRAGGVRAAFRGHWPPEVRFSNLGFRLARDHKAGKAEPEE